MRHIGQSLTCDASIRGPAMLSSVTLTKQGGFFLGCVMIGVYSMRRGGEEGAGAAHTTYTHVMNDLAPCGDFSVSEAGATKKLCILGIKNITNTLGHVQTMVVTHSPTTLPSMGPRGHRPSHI